MLPGLYPFWFWNDRLEPDEIRWQIHEMAHQGVRGFFIHPRQGLEQPYLSDRFFELVEVAIEEAQTQGMVANLYDEYPYPSGVAGGEVVLGNPEFRATQLVHKQFDVASGPVRVELPRGKILAARAYPLANGVVDWQQKLDLLGSVGMVLTQNSYMETGLTRYNQKRYFASHPTPVLETRLPEGDWRILVSAQVEVTGHKYWGNFIDVLNPQAVQAFLELTHERYARRFGQHFGKTVQAIFTDETQPGWSARIPALFEQTYGYDLLEHLEALQDATYPDAARIANDLSRLAYRLFIDTFERPILAWCHAHGIAYSGEKPYLRLGQAQYMDIPGCEPGHTKAGATLDLLGPNARGNARATASAAYFYGKPGALDECYHSLGWSGTLQDAKFMADAMVLMGIRYLVPHGFFFSTHALRKHDAPPTFFFQMPYWPFFGRLSRRIDCIWQQFEGTHIAAQVLVVDPTSGSPEHADKAAYVRLQHHLMSRQIEFLHVDTDLLQSGQIENGRIHLRDVTARVIIVPPMPVIEPELADWLDQFEKSGGRVIRCDRDRDPEVYVSELREAGVQPSLPIRIVSGEQAPSPEANPLWCVRRESDERTLWFLLNTSAGTLEIEMNAGQPIEEVALEEDHLPALETTVSGRYRRAVAPFESFLLRTGGDGQGQPSSQPLVLHLEDGPVQVKALNANLLRMANWQMTIPEPGGDPTISAMVPAAPVANQLAISRLPFTPGVEQAFGVEPRLVLPTLRIQYRFAFHNAAAAPVRLVMEPGSIAGSWNLWVNEHGPFGSQDLTPSTAHVRGSLELEITTALQTGMNELRVELVTDRMDGGLLNPLYLAGDFGVAFVESAGSPRLPALVERSTTGGFETYEENGLPFYAGIVEYALSFDLPNLQPESGEDNSVTLALRTTRPFREAMEIAINGGTFQPVLWEPRKVRAPAGLLHPGKNEAVVRVYTSLIRSFEGQRFDEESHRYSSIV